MNLQHRDNFEAFARFELRCGGPDPHLLISAWLARQSPDPRWFPGLYTIVYNVPSAEVLNHYLPFPAKITEAEAHDLWKKIVVRKERRVNGFGPLKLMETLNAYVDVLEANILEKATDFEIFDEQFEHVKKSVKNYGRYFGIKLYECLRQANAIPLLKFDNMLPKDGQLSRKGLALIYPEHDYKAKDPFSCYEANELAGELLHRLENANWFQVEALLCEFRQASENRQYPGRAHDSELDHLRAVQALNPDVEFRTLEARKELFPHWALGELQGWKGRRSLGHVMNEYGYCWSDDVYDFNKTAELNQFNSPVIRKGGVIDQITEKYDKEREELVACQQ